MRQTDLSQDRPLQRGDAIRLDWNSKAGYRLLFEHGKVWTIERIVPEVWCLNNQPGLRVSSTRNPSKSRWISFPADPHLKIVERLAN